LSCQVTATNAGGSAQATSAAVSVPQAPANSVAPSVTGSPTSGSTLTCAPGTWTGVPAPTLTYQWLRDGNAITGQTTTTYVIADPDAAHALSCQVTATNAGGSLQKTSNAVNVPAVAPTNSVAPSVSGSTTSGSTLTCDPGKWDGFNTPTLTIAWLRDGNAITGQTTTTYVIADPDAAHALSCQVTATNTAGSLQKTSNAVNIPAVAPANTAPPSVTGTLAVGQTVTCDTGVWAGFPAPTFTIVWLRDGEAIDGATATTYLLAPADKGHSVSCKVTATNAVSSAQASSATVDVELESPANSAPPTISGTPSVGGALTCSAGIWTGTPDPALTFQWRRDGQDIDGATRASYSPTAADAGRALTCKVSAKNTVGRAAASSAPVSVPAIAPANTAPPSASGSAATGSTLTCATGTWTGAPAPSLAVAWLRDGQPISGATGTTYTLTAADAGHAISCRVTATNAGGSAQATSQAIKPPAAAKKPAEQVLATKTKDQIAGALGLPSAKACVSKRSFPVRLVAPSGVTIAKVALVVNGKPVKAKKVAGRFSASIDLRGLPKGTFTVTVTITTTRGRKLVGARSYRTCAAKPKLA
ncbi:MAG TPA: hypothetical protein VMT10_00595, partial [Solirubrobacteraceae bacterium]|nr:hypothetical protein [Solirubrobacteraceae bacterium]